MLYHGSKTGKIKILKPKKHPLIKKPAVFATPYREFALAMIYGTDDEFAIGFTIDTKANKRIMYIEELQKEKLQLLEQEGYLYEVEDKDFHTQEGLMPEEVICEKEVPVVKETYIPNIRKELEKLGVEIKYLR